MDDAFSTKVVQVLSIKCALSTCLGLWMALHAVIYGLFSKTNYYITNLQYILYGSSRDGGDKLDK